MICFLICSRAKICAKEKILLAEPTLLESVSDQSKIEGVSKRVLLKKVIYIVFVPDH